MDPVLFLRDSATLVDPGGEARVTVTVRNTGDLVEQYRFDVLGDAARWSQVVPRQVSVLPGGQEEKAVEVVFRPPPAPAAPAGEIPFGVRCVSMEDRSRCAVVEGDVAVGAVHDFTARLEPVTPSGRWAGRYRAHFDNSGTVPVALALDAADERHLLRVAVAPRDLTVPPGRTAAAYISVRPRQPKARGKAVTHGFAVTYRADGSDRGGQLAGSFEQRPIVGKAAIVTAAVALLVAGAGTAMLLRRGDSGTALKAGTGAPPPVEGSAIQQLTAQSAQLVWDANPYAASYVVQQLSADGRVDGTKQITDRDQTAYVWTDLNPGRHCFRVVAVGASGSRSVPARPVCVTAAAPSPTAQPSGTAPTPSAPPTATASNGSATALAPAQTGAGVPGSATASGGSPDAADPVQGYYVIFATVPIEDSASQGNAAQVVTQLQAAGVQARLVDSRASNRLPDGPDNSGLWVVLQDGFPDFATARTVCTPPPAAAAYCFVNRP